MARGFNFQTLVTQPCCLGLWQHRLLWQKHAVDYLMLSGKHKNRQEEATVPVSPPGHAPNDHSLLVPQVGTKSSKVIETFKIQKELFYRKLS